MKYIGHLRKESDDCKRSAENYTVLQKKWILKTAFVNKPGVYKDLGGIGGGN